MLKINGEVITSHHEHNFNDASTYQTLKDYIKNKFSWRDDEFASVDWEVIQQRRKGFTKSENVNISKLMLHWINTGHQKEKMSQEKAFQCCEYEEDTLEHIFQCEDTQVSKARKECFEVMEKIMQYTGPPQVARPFLETLRCICEGRNIELT